MDITTRVIPSIYNPARRNHIPIRVSSICNSTAYARTNCRLRGDSLFFLADFCSSPFYAAFALDSCAVPHSG